MGYDANLPPQGQKVSLPPDGRSEQISKSLV